GRFPRPLPQLAQASGGVSPPGGVSTEDAPRRAGAPGRENAPALLRRPVLHERRVAFGAPPAAVARARRPARGRARAPCAARRADRRMAPGGLSALRQEANGWMTRSTKGSTPAKASRRRSIASW